MSILLNTPIEYRYRCDDEVRSESMLGYVSRVFRV